MDLSAPGLENAILRLDPLVEAHRDTVLNSEIGEAVWRWMPALPGGTSLNNYYDALMIGQQVGLSACFVLFRQADNAFAGVTGFMDINKIHRRVRNAFTWHPPALATPSLYLAGQLAMLRRAYDWRAKRLEWQINPENSFMMAELARLGPTKEAVMRNFERTADGVWVDKIVYSMTRTEMKMAIDRLQRDLFD